MSIVADTGVLVARRNRRDGRHEDAVSLLREAFSGTWGTLYVTDYIVDEAVTLCRVRTGRHEAADDLATALLGEPPYEPAFELLRVGYQDFLHARRLFSEYDDQDLSFTDCTTLAVLRSRSIDHLLSFDDDFDGLAPRVDETP